MTQQLTLENRPLEIKPYRWITLDEQKEFADFLINLEFVDSTKIEKLQWCASEYAVYDCVSDSTHSKKVHYLACGLRGLCPRCSMAYAHKRAEVMYQWIKRNLVDNLNFDVKMNQIVLTLPKGLHEILDRKIFSKMVNLFVRKMGVEAYGYSIQYRHSKNPMAERYLHAHILTLNLKEKNQRIIENQYYFDVNFMRKVWKDIILQYTNFEVDGNVNLHTEYHSVRYDGERTKHILAYLYRYSLQDLFNVQVRNKSINYLEREQFNPCDIILQIESILQDKKTLTWCGLLSSSKREYLVKLIENTVNEYVAWLSIREIVKDLELRAKTCRDCGMPLSQIPFDKGKYQGDNEPLILNQFHGFRG